MICINPKSNPKLLRNFNNDPEYFDIVVQTKNSELRLIMGYLCIDSFYFDQISLDIKTINLKHLPENALIRVLRSLYGEELWARIPELNELYEVITFLKISEYRKNIIKYISEHPELMDSIELVEFCFSKDILKEEVRNHHYKNDLNVFAASKSYLQLNKLSPETLNNLLLKYYEVKGEDSEKTINSILENYFGRTDTNPRKYLSHPDLEILLNVWQKWHPTFAYFSPQQNYMNNSVSFMPSSNQKEKEPKLKSKLSTPVRMDKSPKKPFVSVSPGKPIDSITILDHRINQLETELNLKKEIANKLMQEIIYLKSFRNQNQSESEKEKEKNNFKSSNFETHIDTFFKKVYN